MKKKTVSLHFNYDIDNYKAGRAYKLELTEVEEKRLLRRGCIYASKDAKYYQEEKEIKEVLKKEPEMVNPAKEEIKDVDHKDSKQAKVQTRRSKPSKSKE